MQQGEVGIEWFFLIKDEQGKPFDLTDASGVKLVLRRGITTWERTCTIVDATAGKVGYVLTKEDLVKPGMYTFQLVITYPDGGIVKTNIFREKVNDSLEAE